MNLKMKKFLNMVVAVTLLAGIFPVAAESSSDHGAPWGYKGETGPEHWGNLKKDFAPCKAGKKQSPINLVEFANEAAPALVFDYKPTSLNVVNNGHTIQVNYAPGSFLRVGDETFELLQFHFHTPSEHVVKGKPFDMEMHLVHKSSKGELAVVGIFMGKAMANPGLKSIWENLPAEVDRPLTKENIKINARDILPGNSSYFYYPGSLTTPPCSEGVRWHILNQPVGVSTDQIDKFKELIHDNSRPAQALNDRQLRKTK